MYLVVEGIGFDILCPTRENKVFDSHEKVVFVTEGFLLHPYLKEGMEESSSKAALQVRSI